MGDALEERKEDFWVEGDYFYIIGRVYNLSESRLYGYGRNFYKMEILNIFECI